MTRIYQNAIYIVIGTKPLEISTEDELTRLVEFLLLSTQTAFTLLLLCGTTPERMLPQSLRYELIQVQGQPLSIQNIFII